jgi:hypothetical protein
MTLVSERKTLQGSAYRGFIRARGDLPSFSWRRMGEAMAGAVDAESGFRPYFRRLWALRSQAGAGDRWLIVPAVSRSVALGGGHAMKVSAQRSTRRLLADHVRLVSHGHHEPASALTWPHSRWAVILL